eukprot:TRINITY_DN24774_c0_g1_i1.p2 TRINITY_DN24774_c0_g1~~TRINITY_DN24774_c0_g1_i1.p2  ORF type:complete len:163 (+),score=40.40 TRINITY_DN24774_c0_g1_i1:73-561(+)
MAVEPFRWALSVRRYADAEAALRSVSAAEAPAAARALRDLPAQAIGRLGAGDFAALTRMVAAVGTAADAVGLRMAALRRRAAADWADWAELARDLLAEGFPGNAAQAASRAVALLSRDASVPPAHAEVCLRALYELKADALRRHLPDEPHKSAAAGHMARRV